MGMLQWRARKSGIPADDADDMVQETFAAYFNHYPVDWEDVQKKAMLLKILKNKCTDYFRKNSRYQCVSMDAKGFDEAAVLSDYVTEDTLDYILTKELWKDMQEIMRNLKKDWRDIAVLHIIEQRSLPEVCQILELDSSVCRMRLSRIRKYLRAQYRDRY